MNILFEPMFSKRSLPLRWIGQKRFTCPSVSVKELPHLDIVMLSHDHYDHLDRSTVQQLANKTDCFIVSLELEKHLEHWHFCRYFGEFLCSEERLITVQVYYVPFPSLSENVIVHIPSSH